MGETYGQLRRISIDSPCVSQTSCSSFFEPSYIHIQGYKADRWDHLVESFIRVMKTAIIKPIPRLHVTLFSADKFVVLCPKSLED